MIVKPDHPVTVVFTSKDDGREIYRQDTIAENIPVRLRAGGL